MPERIIPTTARWQQQVSESLERGKKLADVNRRLTYWRGFSMGFLTGIAIMTLALLIDIWRAG